MKKQSGSSKPWKSIADLQGQDQASFYIIAAILFGRNALLKNLSPPDLAGTVFYVEPSLKKPVLKITGYDINGYDSGQFVKRGK